MSKFFQLEELPGRVTLLTLDVPEQKVNTLGEPVLAELAEIVAGLEEQSDLTGLLFCSGKQGQFIAGADLKELAALAEATPSEVAEKLRAGHELFTRVSRLPFPTVALIDGNCMGGGTELVLAMDGRIASDAGHTRLALPEVTIGLIPGWGGTQRLPRLVGINAAIDMICGGQPLSAEKARAIGLVFDVVPNERLVEEAKRLLELLHEDEQWQMDRERRNRPLGLSRDELEFAFAIAEGSVQAKTKGHFPAPPAALKAMKEGVNLPLEEGLAVEREVALEVTGSPISANLIGVFFMNNQVNRDPGVDDPHVKPRDVRRVGVLGAGLMGAGIATAHARAGVSTSMVDVDLQRLDDGLQRATDVVASRIKIGRATQEDLAAMLARLNTSTSQKVFAECDVVVEAVPENEELKKQVFGQLAEVLSGDAILASNTSTISITRMAAAAPHPERFVGMHFFYPVDRMALVEVIRGEKTDDETVATIVALARRIKKTPIVCKDCAGFLVNRLLLPYMNEAVLLLTEGASMDRIDKAATAFGMPMGPIALHDLVGLDTAWHAGKEMVAAYSDRAVATPLLGDLVQAGRLGNKSGAGFRKYQGKKKPAVPDPEFIPFLEKHRTSERRFEQAEVTDRLFLPMLFEASRALEEEIVSSPAHLDMGMILGTGFPTFRGGLLRWCDNEGAAALVDRAAKYAELGKRFEPTETLHTMASSGEKFYPHGAAVN